MEDEDNVEERWKDEGLKGKVSRDIRMIEGGRRKEVRKEGKREDGRDTPKTTCQRCDVG